MNMNLNISLPSFLLLAWLLLHQHCIAAVQYIVTNKAPNIPGSKLFDDEIGINFTLQTMVIANKFIWNIFGQHNSSEIKYAPVLNVYISDFTGAMGYTNGDNINISTPALDKYFFPSNKSKFYFTSLMHHEMTHIFQWSGNRTAPGGLTEGIVDYVMVKSGIYNKTMYTKPGSGSRWDEGYGVTERFLEYCDSLRKGFTVELNKKMRYAYSDNYFVELLGKPVDQLWREYKAKYGNIHGAAGSSSMFPGIEY